MHIVVTGGSGKLGNHVVSRLRGRGDLVLNVDRQGPRRPGTLTSDLSDYGQVIDALTWVQGERWLSGPPHAVVHLAAIPAPGVTPDIDTFRHNMVTTFSVIHAAVKLGVRNIVCASSETVLGVPFDQPPEYLPVDEDSPTRPMSVYALAKELEEETARQFCAWYPDLKIVSLRFSNVTDVDDYAQFPLFDIKPERRKWNLWSYIDGRDAALAVERSLDFAEPGFHCFNIASEDTVMKKRTADLAAQWFPGVPVRKELGEHESLISIERAREVIGYTPKRSWRHHHQHR